MKKKIIIILLTICGLGLLGTGIYFQFFNKSEGTKTSEKKDEDTLVTNQLWVDFNEGKITSDEYVKYNIYNIYDKSLLDEKYHYDVEIRIDNLIDKYYDELSDDTIKLYLDYYSLSNITFQIDSDVPEVKPTSNKKQEENTINLNKVYLSSNSNFLVWYTDKGNSSVSYDKVKEYGELLENAIEQYDNIFNLKYSFKASILSKGNRYQDQIKILNNNNIDEKYMSESMHVYIYDLNNGSLGGTYSSMDYSNNKLINFINNYLYESEDGTIITPYISLNSELINKKNHDFKDTVNHELFHHYQDYIINNNGSRRVGKDTVIGESTANWAAAKITENMNKNNGLNINVSNYLKHTGDIFTDMYDKIGPEVGYATFKFLEAYEQNVPNGMNKILDSIHYDDGFKYLNEKAMREEKVDVIKDLALKNLNNDYPNNNYLSTNNEKVRVKKEITKDIDYRESINLSKIGIDYYSFKPTLEDNYEVKISSIGNDCINVWVILEKDNSYQIMSSKTNIVDSFSVNTFDYSDYEIGYIVVANSDFSDSNTYDITIKSSDYSINNSDNNIVKWGTATPIKYQDKKYGTVDIVAYGNITYQVLDNTTVSEYDKDSMSQAVLSAFAPAILKHNGDSYISLMNLMAQEKEQLLNDANEYIVDHKYKIVDIDILSIDLTEESKAKVDELQRDEVLNNFQNKNETTFNTTFDNYKIKATSTIEMSGITTESVIEGLMDEKHQKEYLKTTTETMGIEVVVESYTDFHKGYSYTSVPFSTTWEKSKSATQFVDLTTIMEKLEKNSDVTKISDNEYKIKLTSKDVNGLMNSNGSVSSSELNGDIYVKAFLTGGYVTKLVYDFSGLLSGIDKFTMTIEFSDFNNAGNVEIPSAVMN